MMTRREEFTQRFRDVLDAVVDFQVAWDNDQQTRVSQKLAKARVAVRRMYKLVFDRQATPQEIRELGIQELTEGE